MMYLNKQHYYENSEKDDYRHYSYIRQELIKSIEMGSFVVYLQPKVYASDGRIYGAEALVRYQHEKAWSDSAGTFHLSAGKRADH